MVLPRFGLASKYTNETSFSLDMWCIKTFCVYCRQIKGDATISSNITTGWNRSYVSVMYLSSASLQTFLNAITNGPTNYAVSHHVNYGERLVIVLGTAFA